MGNDGGDIPRRKELVKEKKKDSVVSAELIARSRARYCAFTNSRLKEPLAVCRLGCIYNYETLLDAMLKKTLPNKFSYIRKLPDIKKISIQRSIESSENFFVCPVTKLQYNGFNKFVCLWKCGHVISQKAFKEIKIKVEEEKKRKCIVCETQYSQQDVVDLNLDYTQMEKKRIELIKKVLEKDRKKRDKERAEKRQDHTESEPQKRVKIDMYVNPLQRLGGEFRDTLRGREQFKDVFKKQEK